MSRDFRTLMFDRTVYRWRMSEGNPPILTVVLDDESDSCGQRLCVTFASPFSAESEFSKIPWKGSTGIAYLVTIIRAAVLKGWKPNESGPDFCLELPGGADSAAQD